MQRWRKERGTKLQTSLSEPAHRSTAGRANSSQAHLCSRTSSSLTEQTISVSTVAFQSCPGGAARGGGGGSGRKEERQLVQKSSSRECIKIHILIKSSASAAWLAGRQRGGRHHNNSLISYRCLLGFFLHILPAAFWYETEASLSPVV